MIFLILLMLLQPITAYSQEVLVADEDVMCLDATLQAEEKYQIKEHLLTSISNVETGRWNEFFQQKTAWPWTINVKGRGYYYKTKEEAVAAVRQWQKRGYKSIDVGCMQVNLRFHGKEFSSLEDAFDPRKNVEVAARILQKRYKIRNDWMTAATDYHSTQPKKALRYRQKLMLAMEGAKSNHEQYLARYASNFLVIRDNRSWLAKLLKPNDKSKEITLSARD